MNEQQEKYRNRKQVAYKLLQEMAWELDREVFEKTPRLVMRSWVTRINRLIEDSKSGQLK